MDGSYSLQPKAPQDVDKWWGLVPLKPPISTATSTPLSLESDVMNQLCRVCGELAAGFHFGAFTCEGCKSFFGRTYNNVSAITECKNNSECVINKKNRTSCKACRLRKCLMVGMSKSGSRYGRRSNWFKIHCLLQEQQHKAQITGLNQQSSNTSSSPSKHWDRVCPSPEELAGDSSSFLSPSSSTSSSGINRPWDRLRPTPDKKPRKAILPAVAFDEHTSKEGTKSGLPDTESSPFLNNVGSDLGFWMTRTGIPIIPSSSQLVPMPIFASPFPPFPQSYSHIFPSFLYPRPPLSVKAFPSALATNQPNFLPVLNSEKKQAEGLSLEKQPDSCSSKAQEKPIDLSGFSQNLKTSNSLLKGTNFELGLPTEKNMSVLSFGTDLGSRSDTGRGHHVEEDGNAASVPLDLTCTRSSPS